MPGPHVKKVNVHQDMKYLLELVDIYPELFSALETILFKLLKCLETTSLPGISNMLSLFTKMVTLLEKMDSLEQSRTSAAEQRKYLVVPFEESYYNSNAHIEVRVHSVSAETWALLLDEASLMASYDVCECTLEKDKTCTCGGRKRCNWADPNDIMSSIKNRSLLLRQRTYEDDEDVMGVMGEAILGEDRDEDMQERNWKVNYDSDGDSMEWSWKDAIKELRD